MGISKTLKILGPGIMFASAAIGVSHLVQSTRAGADYGLTFWWAIVIANVLKYPFFEFGSRYASARGESILSGYLAKHKILVWIFLLLSIATMFAVTSAVTFVTAGLLVNIAGQGITTDYAALGILVFCSLVLVIGKFNALDNLLKIVGVCLLISTVAAFTLTLIHGPIAPDPDFIPKPAYGREGQLFMIALMGWMPAPLDLSVWNSIWTVEKKHNSNAPISMKDTLFDFNLGYWGSGILSLCFLTLGAYLMFGSGEELSEKAPVFASQVVRLFTSALGKWSYPVIAVSALSVMVSTTITVIDGYGRSLSETINLLTSRPLKTYRWWLIVLVVGSFFTISSFLNQLKTLVDLATILSFVIAPFIAIINLWVIRTSDIDPRHQPGKIMIALSYAGIAFLCGFTIYFIKLFFIDG